MHSPRAVFGRILWLLSGDVVVTLGTVAFLALVARQLGPAEFGDFAYALAASAIAGVFADFGLTAYVTREVARRPEATGRIFWAAAIGRAIVAMIVFSLFMAFILSSSVWNVQTGGLARNPYLALLGATQVLVGLAAFLVGCLVALGRAAARSAVVTAAPIVSLGLAALPWAWNIPYFAAYCAMAGSAAAVVIAWFQISRLVLPSPKRTDWAEVTRVLRVALPLAFMGVVVVVLLRLDTLLLGLLRRPEEVGLYVAASRISESILVLPALVAVAMMPTLSDMLRSNPERMRDLVHRLIKHAFAAGAIAAFAGAILGPWILALVFGKAFAGSVALVALLFAGAGLMFMTSILGMLVILLRREQSVYVTGPSIILLCIILNLWWVPEHGVLGTAAAKLTCELAGLGMGLWIVRGVAWTAEGTRGLMPPFLSLVAGGSATAILWAFYLAPSWCFLGGLVVCSGAYAKLGIDDVDRRLAASLLRART